MALILECGKYLAAQIAGNTAHTLGSQTLYLGIGPLQDSSDKVEEIFSRLTTDQKNKVYGKVYELAKMYDPTITGTHWGEIHAQDDSERLKKALHRCGFLGDHHLHKLKCLDFKTGEGGLGSQYFSLNEKAKLNPITGYVGYVNGMGHMTLEHSGNDAVRFSDLFIHGNNLHCVYHSTHQNDSSLGYLWDVYRMKAVDGGCYTKTSYLIAQLWIDFFSDHPGQNFLQAAHSEGAVHVAAALRLISTVRPDLLPFIRVINFCPAYFIMPNDFPGIQVINIVKKEDSSINPWATRANQIGTSPYIIVVKHTTQDDPHNHLTDDFVHMLKSKGYVDTFMRTGDIFKQEDLDSFNEDKLQYKSLCILL